MIGLYDTEFIGLKKLCYGVTFECAFVLLYVELEKIKRQLLKVNFNIFEYNKSLWGTIIRQTNRLGFYDRAVTLYNKRAREVRTQSCSGRSKRNMPFFGVEALYIKVNMPKDKGLIKKCDPKILLFNL